MPNIQVMFGISQSSDVINFMRLCYASLFSCQLVFEPVRIFLCFCRALPFHASTALLGAVDESYVAGPPACYLRMVILRSSYQFCIQVMNNYLQITSDSAGVVGTAPEVTGKCWATYFWYAPGCRTHPSRCVT